MAPTPDSPLAGSGDATEPDPGVRSAPVKALVSGGIGSGKSAVARMLAMLGAHVIDADAIGHEMLAGVCHDEVALRWPGVVRDGRIDRAALADIVFAKPAELAALEAITHPAIAARIAEEVERTNAPVVVVEMPLLKNLMGEGWLRIVVDAGEAVRVRRLLERGMQPEDIRARMMVQPNRRAWLAAADVVVGNDGSLADLESEVAAVWRRLTEPVATSDAGD